jgi:hypothetical protein
METVIDKIAQVKFKLFSLSSILVLALFSFMAMAQPGNTSDDSRGSSSKADQSTAYLRSIEMDPNGVPNTAAWYAQPWVWAIIASILILVVGLVFKSYGKRDTESEHGL